MNNKTIWTKEFFLITLINLTTFFGFNMTTIGIPIYVSQLGSSDLIAGLVTSLGTGAALLIRPFTGIMLNRYGRKNILVISIGLMSVIIISYAIFPILGVILTLRILHGIGWGLGSTATSTIVSDVIPKKRFAEGMGYFALASAISTALAPALSVALVQKVGITPMIIIAASCTILSFIFSIFQPTDKLSQRKEGGKLQISDFFDKKALLPAGIMFLLNCAFGSVITFIALYSKSTGVDNIYLYFTIYALVTIISRPIIGKMIDKIGFFIPGILSTLAVAITLVLIAFSTNIVMFCIAGIFAGLGMGTGMGTLQTMAVASVSSERRGVATSTFLFGVDAGVAIGSILAGAIADILGYANMYLVLSSIPVIACVIIVIIGRERILKFSQK